MTAVTKARFAGAIAAAMALLAAVVPGSAAATGSRHEVYPVPPGGVYTLHGRGFGHGHGMSQWGAYGAAKVAKLSANQILHFYYPHTVLATKSASRQIRVLLSAADSPATGYVEVASAAGLTVTAAAAKPYLLPTQAPGSYAITHWRVKRSGSAFTLRGQWHGSWHTVSKHLASPVVISDTASMIPVVEPAGGTATKTIRYRGRVDAEVQAGQAEAVNQVVLEQYLRSVVPSEMPASWTMAALQAQAVAARTYAWRGLKSPKASWFDLYGDTRDQGYGGVGSETARTDKAVHATAGEVVVDATGAPILAQYSSADGGWTVSGGVSYLPAKHDPYDGAVPNTSHAWTTTLSAAAIASAYPAIGALRSIVVTGRDGHGLWGGRVSSLTLTGTKSSVSVSGTAFQLAFGLRSPWFRPVPTPGAVQQLKATASGRTVTVTWKPPAAISGAAAVSGYRVSLAPGKAVQKLAASTLTATFAKAPTGTDTVSVVATSAAGNGPAATVTAVVKAAN